MDILNKSSRKYTCPKYIPYAVYMYTCSNPYGHGPKYGHKTLKTCRMKITEVNNIKGPPRNVS